MKENLYYLFAAGLILGSGPCLTFCAPLLIGYTATHHANVRKALISYGIFSFFKLIGYGLLGLAFGMGASFLQGQSSQQYTRVIYVVLGVLISCFGLITLLSQHQKAGRICSVMTKGHARNVGVFGFLVGLSPCLPLIGILNYIFIISKTPLEAVFFVLIFGLGTVVSPLVLLMVVSSKFSQIFSQNNKAKTAIKFISGGILLLLGIQVIVRYGL